MSRRLVVGNWKMNASRQGVVELLAPFLAEVGPLLAEGAAVEVVICPPFPYLAAASEQLGRDAPVALGAQDVSQHEAGAHTGEVSVAMLLDFSCRWVLVGHSERRQAQAETDQAVAGKCVRAQQAGLVPIVCVGETLEQREAGQVQSVLARQLDAVLAARALEQPFAVAYEPVWAIGSGRVATTEHIQQTHAFLRERLSAAGKQSGAGQTHPEFAAQCTDGRGESGARQIPILYGGSVNADNAPELFALQDVDGVLVGGASLRAEDFLRIVRAAVEA